MADDKMRKRIYSQQAKELFWRRLREYQTALTSGTARDIVTSSLAIHAALGNVPASYKRYVNKAQRDAVRTQPL